MLGPGSNFSPARPFGGHSPHFCRSVIFSNFGCLGKSPNRCTSLRCYRLCANNGVHPVTGTDHANCFVRGLIPRAYGRISGSCS